MNDFSFECNAEYCELECDEDCHRYGYCDSCIYEKDCPLQSHCISNDYLSSTSFLALKNMMGGLKND